MEAAAHAAFDIHDHVGQHEGQVRRQRVFRLDLDADGALEIVVLVDLGARVVGGALQPYLLPVILKPGAGGHRRVPAEGLPGGTIHNLCGVALRLLTGGERPDLVINWSGGESASHLFVLRWAGDRYVLARRAIDGLREPYAGPSELEFWVHYRQIVQFADTDGDGVDEVIQSLLFFPEELAALGYAPPELSPGDWCRVCRVSKWDREQERFVVVQEGATVGSGLPLPPRPVATTGATLRGGSHQ